MDATLYQYETSPCVDDIIAPVPAQVIQQIPPTALDE